MPSRPRLALVTPALADADNGNWRTAARWARLLAPHWDVRLTDRWQAGGEDAALMLHARRSAASIAAWRERRGDAPLIVVLTGTDLYRDIHEDASARRSLDLADRLVLLNEHAPQDLPPRWRGKARVCLQSCPAWQARTAHPARHLRVLTVGHLREEKGPDLVFDAVRRLDRPDIRWEHVGRALAPEWARRAAATAAACPGYRWLGPLPHPATRRRIRNAGVLVHPSRLEGGAQAVIEALRSGTAVIATRIPGNVGLLGEDHPGLVDPDDGAALAAAVARCRDDPAMLPALRAAGAALAPRFAPEAERRTLLALLAPRLPAAPLPPSA
jgi:putative glycosyltransferase (TIGR04348 family)